jgi:hypothetical protein
MDAKTKKTWISIAIAIVIIVVILGVALVGTAFFVFRQHVNAQFVSSRTAEQEFRDARQRFSGQRPLIEVVPGDKPVIHQREGKEIELQTLRALAFDPATGKLVRVSMPFWLLRMAPSRHFSFRSSGDFDFDSERLNLTLDDVERAGPGLLLDTRDPRKGTLVLVWTE